MLFNRFIDRQRELADLLDFFSSSPRASKVIFVSGKSGVGKSQFTAEFVKIAKASHSIRVACPVPAFDKTVKDGIFIRNLSQQVNENSIEQGFQPIVEFANRLDTYALAEDYDKRLLEDGRRFSVVAGFNALRTIIRRKQKRAFRTEDLYRLSASWQPIIHHDYIFAALKSLPIVIVLENFQLVDYESLVLIQHLVQILPVVTWILEYTETDKPTAHLRTYEEFHRLCGFRSKQLPLVPIPIEEILSESQKYIPFVTTSLIEQQYREHGGNLRILLDTTIIATDKETNKNFESRLKQNPEIDATGYRIGCLDHSGLFLLALILANDAHIETAILEMMYAGKISDLRLAKFLDTFSAIQKNNLIVCTSREALIAHDKVSDSFGANPAHSIIYRLALNVSAEFYEKCKATTYSVLPGREVGLRLLKIRLQTNPLMIFAQFSELREAVLRSATRSEAEAFLNAVKIGLQRENGVSESAWWDLAHLCYEANLHNLASEISEHRSRTGNWHLLRGFILHNLDRNEDAVAEIEPLFENKVPEAALLTALVLKMVCFRSLGKFEGAKEIARTIDGDARFHTLPEFGHFLRNVEFIRGPEEGLLSVRKSIECFSKMGRIDEERQAKVTLAMQLARLGQTKAALTELRAILKRQELRAADSYIIWNDIAAAEMMEGDYSNNQLNLLERSSLTSVQDFDRIVTASNLAIWHANNDRIAYALELLAGVDHLVECETDAHLRCALFFNRSVVLTKAGRIAEAAMWQDKLQQELEVHDVGYKKYWQARANLGPCDEQQFKFLLTLSYHYLFLVHWSFPLRIHFKWK